MLAHIDAEAAAFASVKGTRVYAKHLRLLAYAQVSRAQARRAETDRDALVFCSLEHLAYLLGRFYPEADVAASPHGLSVICEASNVAQRGLLEMLGFATLKSPSGRRERVRTSPAGFALCECEIPPAPHHRGGGRGLMGFVEAVSKTVSAKS